jgi:hypothetical protein
MPSLSPSDTNFMAQGDVGIKEEGLFGSPAKEEDSDDEDDCEFEGGHDDDYEDGRATG